MMLGMRGGGPKELLVACDVKFWSQMILKVLN